MKAQLGLPSVVWVVVILALIPGFQTILEQFFPSTEYWYSAVIVAILASVARGVQVWAQEQGIKIELEEGTPMPAASAQPMVLELKQPSKLRRWLI